MKVIKRDGRLEEFTPDKIYKAVKAAYTQVYVEDHDKIEKVVKKVFSDIADMDAEQIPITVIQAFVESRLIDVGYIKVAEKYIEYRLQRDIERYGYGEQIVASVNLGRIK